MRQTVVGVFTQQASAEATLQRLELRGFRAECVGAASGDAPRPSGPRGAWRDLKARLPWLADALPSPWSQAPRQGEVFVKVEAGSALEAQAAREILRAAGARESGCLGEGWTNWNW